MDKHRHIAGKIQQVVAALCLFGTLALMALIFALGSWNVEGTSHFHEQSLYEYLASPYTIILIALACVFAAQFYWARSWANGNQRARYPLACFAVLQLLSLYLIPVAIYSLWALFRPLPADEA
jgi:Na+-driven multidrug efflux pump